MKEIAFSGSLSSLRVALAALAIGLINLLHTTRGVMLMPNLEHTIFPLCRQVDHYLINILSRSNLLPLCDNVNKRREALRRWGHHALRRWGHHALREWMQYALNPISISNPAKAGARRTSLRVRPGQSSSHRITGQGTTHGYLP